MATGPAVVALLLLPGKGLPEPVIGLILLMPLLVATQGLPAPSMAIPVAVRGLLARLLP